MEITIEAIEAVTEKELLQINQIITECNSYDRTGYVDCAEDDFKQPGDINHFILYEKNTPLATIFLFCPTQEEAELYAFTLPDHRRKGHMKSLLAEVMKELRRRSVPSLLFVCDSRSISGKAFLNSRGRITESSEYSLLWHPPLEEIEHPSVHLRKAEQNDIEVLTAINSEAFNEEPAAARGMMEKFLSSPVRDFFAVITGEGNIVGMIGRYIEEKQDYIHGFAMDSRVRGRGWGREALLQMIRHCRDLDPSRPIVLEVSCENEQALGLYLRCGFRNRSRFDYCREPVTSS